MLPGIDTDEIPYISQYPTEEQEKIIAKKLKLYQKTKENIAKEIKTLLAIAGNKELSPANVNNINRLISNMRSLDKRMELYTKKDEAFRKQRQQREKLMVQENQKKKLKDKIKQQKKKLEDAKDDQQKQGLSSFLLPGKWLDVYRKNQQNRINELEKNITKSEGELKTLEKATKTQPAPKAPARQGQTTGQTPMKVEKKPQDPKAVEATSKASDVEGRSSIVPAHNARPSDIAPTKPSVPMTSQPVKPLLGQDPPITHDTTRTPQPLISKAKIEEQPASVQNAKPAGTQINPKQNTTEQQKPKKEKPMFADLFAAPQVKGTPTPKTLPGQVMQQLEQKRSSDFEKQSAEIRRKEAKK